MRALAAGLDVTGVVAFVVIGRLNHAEGTDISGLGRTLWPFLAGVLAGWLITRAWRTPLGVRWTGVGIWLTTVAVGMALRVVAGQGTAIAFILVALVFLGLFLLGWRVLAQRPGRLWPRPGSGVG